MPSKSKAQRKLMTAVAHNPAFAKEVGIPQSVGKEFTGYAGGGAVTKLAALISKLKEATSATEKAYTGVNPELLKTFAMQVKGPEGAALGETLSPEMLKQLSEATPILRRKSLKDLNQAQLGNIFTTNNTGAAAPVDYGRLLRMGHEPAMFGDNPTYGALVKDVVTPTQAELRLNKPGNTKLANLKPKSVVSQYGPYGFVPRDKSKLTYTLGDSMDDAGTNAKLEEVLSNATLQGGHHDSSALGVLAKAYTDLIGPEGISQGLAEAGVQGLPRYGGPAGSLAFRQARLLPRSFGSEGLPLSPMEEYMVADLERLLSGKHPSRYVEVQGHGLTPDDISQVIDYSVNPSLKVEKSLKKLGIDYNPVVPSGSELGQLYNLKQSGASPQEFITKLRELGYEDEANSLEGWSKEGLPKVWSHYAEGGTVKHPEMEHKASKGYGREDGPLEGSVLKALVRGWIAGTAGLPGDLEQLVRKGVNWSFGPGGVNVDEYPAMPTTDFYKEWLPGKQPGDEAVSTAGSIFGGVGVGTTARGLAQTGKVTGKQAAELLRRGMEGSGPLSRIVAPAQPMNILKGKGGNWLSGSVEDSLKGLKQSPTLSGEAIDEASGKPLFEAYQKHYRAGNETDSLHKWLAQNHPDTFNALMEPRDVALNNWIDKQLTRYIKNDMATEGDPIRALAERGVLHKPLGPDARPSPTLDLRVKREHAGFNPNGVANSDLATYWENLSDETVDISKAKDLLGNKVGTPRQDLPWVEKLPPETPVYSADYTRSLGFDHLIDELRNATDINSGLPAHLRLDPESLARVSVPQAVERVAKINEWRAAQQAEADLARANNAATVLHKDYPEKGYKWVELKKGEQLPEGWSEELVDTPLGKLKKLRDPKTGGLTATDPREEALRDALKYEGDTMGHCVGGYCDDVASGRTKIYSLRDAKGEPHVTVEVAPQKRWNTDTIPNTEEDIGQRIVQIKGKQNRKPNDEYLPFVQDFVRSGKWSDVGDLQNTGLTRVPKESPLAKKLAEVNEPVPDWMTDEEYDALTTRFQMPKYASGGSVKAPTWQDAYEEFQKAHREQYGIGIDRPWSKDEDAARAKQQIDQRYIDALNRYDPTLTPDASVLGVNAQPNTYVPKPDKGGWFSQQLSNVGDIFRPVVQSVDDFGKDVRKAAGDTVGSAAQLGSEATGGVLSPDAVKVAAAVAYLMSTGDVAGAEKVAEASGLSAAELALSEAPTFAFTPEIASSLNTSIFQSPFITGTSGATMSDAVMASLTGNGGQLGLNAANIGQTADQILNSARLQDFLAANTRGLVENTAAGFAGPVGGPALNFGKMVSGGMPLDVAATKAVGSVALGKAVQEAAKQTGVPAPILSVGVTGKAPTPIDLAKTGTIIYNQQNARSNRARRI